MKILEQSHTSPLQKDVTMNTHNDPEDVEYLAAIELRKRPVTEDQFRKFEGYAAEIFSAFGLDLCTAATQATPRRFIEAL
jgi:hypothetical protein